MIRLLFFIFFPSLILASDMVLVKGGNYNPIFVKEKIVRVANFFIDETPVTNLEFLSFVKKNPQWKKSNAKSLFVDSNYLKHWKSDEEVGDKSLNKSPVVNVSWFSAKAYCEWQGKQLPTIDEWEYLAQFGPADNSKDVKNLILEWYSQETPKKLPNVKSTFKNKFGVWDVHGLIWEWNYDFNTTFVTGESRGDSALDKSMFCGSGAVGAADPSDYASFMRFGFRSSLKGNYTVPNLGFRCAKGEK